MASFSWCMCKAYLRPRFHYCHFSSSSARDAGSSVKKNKGDNEFHALIDTPNIQIPSSRGGILFFYPNVTSRDLDFCSYPIIINSSMNKVVWLCTL